MKQIGLFKENLTREERDLLLLITDWRSISLGDIVYQKYWKVGKAYDLLSGLVERGVVVKVNSTFGPVYEIKESFDKWQREKCGIDDPSRLYLVH